VLKEPIRRTRAEIDLDALSANIDLLWKRSGSRHYMILLKADAYGHGNIACARLAEEAGVSFGGVAIYQEAHELRSAGISLPLLVLEDLFDDEIAPALADKVSISVSSLGYAEKVAAAAEKRRETARVHINVDTGMGRLGCFPDQVFEIARFINRCDVLQLEGIFSHFPASDEGRPQEPRGQIESYRALLLGLEQEGISPKYRHIANSGAVIDLLSDAAFDMVRPGISTFGLYPSEKVDHSAGLRQVMSLKSAILTVKKFPPGSGIGYGSTFVTRRESRIGVVPLGYGDGYLRRFSGNAFALVHGTRVPVVGRVSMDMITLDLTDLPEAVSPGDEVVLAGRQHWEDRQAEVSIEELAKRAGTITYEITCLVGKRVPRVYSGGSWQERESIKSR
jgi:alanine racemase